MIRWGMPTVVVIPLVQYAAALWLSKTAATCDNAAWSHTLELLRDESLKELHNQHVFRGNPCVDEDVLAHVLENGEDPEDLYEYREVPEAFRPNISVTVNVTRNSDGRYSSGCTKSLLPNLLYIGLNHAGSSTLCEILNRVPSVSYGQIKEHWYFATAVGSYFNTTIINYPLRRRSLNEYIKEFEVSCDVKAILDCSASYFSLGNPNLEFKNNMFLRKPGRTAVENVKNVLGADTKIIFTVRDPVDWLSSNGFVGNHAAEEFICMADALEQWLAVFPRENFLFMNGEEMFQDLRGHVNRMLEHAGVEDRVTAIGAGATAGRRRNTRTVEDAYRRSYHSEPKHRDCKERLARLTGLKLNWKLSN